MRENKVTNRVMRGIKARLGLAWGGPTAVGRFYRPVMFAISQAGITIHVDVDGALAPLGLDRSDPPPPDNGGPASNQFPDFYNTESLTRVALWNVVRAKRPDIVVETGIANGVSTRTILRAMEANGSGHLYSFDVDERALSSVTGAIRERWTPVIVNSKSAMEDLRSWAHSKSGEVDVWYHDSDHSYEWQRAEFELALNALASGGVLVSDDIDGNEAFADFALSHPTIVCTALFDARKLCGFALKSPSRSNAAEPTTDAT